VSAEEGSLGEIRRALAGITRRLDALADAVGVAAATEPPGFLLDEPTRARLASLESLLAIGRGTTPSETLILGLDRALSHGRADCAAIFQSAGGNPPIVLAHRGVRLRLEPDAAEVVQAGPGLGGPDTLLEHHRLGAALAIPIPDRAGIPAGALLVGRRRAAPPSIPSDAISRLRRRVLVVDDETAIRETLGQALEGNGYHVDTAGDVGDAVALLGRVPVDLVVTDLVLPRARAWRSPVR
jgi:CheY-like chemotaxis protein